MGLKFVNLNQLPNYAYKGFVVSLDTEGGPKTLSQISLVNGEGATTLNTYVKDGKLKGTIKNTWNSVFRSGKLLIGYNIGSDLKAIQSVKLSVPSDVIVVDLYYTYMHLLENNQIKKAEGGNDLEGVAKVFGITNVCGYHNSLVDATVTMRLFWKMLARSNGQFVVVQGDGGNLKALMQRAIEEAEMMEKTCAVNTEEQVQVIMPVPEVTESAMNESHEKEETNLTIAPKFEYEAAEEGQLYRISKHVYEGVIETKGGKELVRLTAKEYKLFSKIQKYTPHYPLSVFYSTIVQPGTMQRTALVEEKMRKEAEKKEKKELAKPEENVSSVNSSEPPKFSPTSMAVHAYGPLV